MSALEHVLRLAPALVDHAVIFGVGTDPEPDHVAMTFDGERTVMEADAHGPLIADPFEMQRRVASVGFEKHESGIGQGANVGREGVVAIPEA